MSNARRAATFAEIQLPNDFPKIVDVRGQAAQRLAGHPQRLRALARRSNSPVGSKLRYLRIQSVNRASDCLSFLRDVFRFTLKEPYRVLPQ